MTDFKARDRVRVTRRPKEGGVSVWEGVLVTVAPNGGFQLDGVHLGTGKPEHGYFSDAATLLRLYGCVQTVEVLAGDAGPGDAAAAAARLQERGDITARRQAFTIVRRPVRRR
ncbi:hypothetical protein GCM10022254_09630 [Actinomadura meridiana]|uniref:Uncharacterized protein n=1 Tax=Actinomadura meridiana TaxID=559626 RepID=A0ABP8BTY3_9ACTN